MAKEYCICGNWLCDTSCIDALGDDENVMENEEIPLEEMKWYKEGPAKDYWRMQDHHSVKVSEAAVHVEIDVVFVSIHRTSYSP